MGEWAARALLQTSGRTLACSYFIGMWRCGLRATQRRYRIHPVFLRRRVRIRRPPLVRWRWASGWLGLSSVGDGASSKAGVRECAPGGVIREAGQHIGKPGLRIDVVELGGGDEGVDGRGAPAALIGAGEGPISSSHGRFFTPGGSS